MVESYMEVQWLDEQSFDWRLLVQSQTSKNHYIKMRTVREWILF